MKITFIVLTVLASLLFVLYVYFDGLKKVNIKIAKQGGETLVYEEYIGDYRNSAIVMDRIYYSLMQNEGIKTFRGFGIYYDDPRKVERNRLRSEAGCILEDPGNEILDNLAGKYNIKLLPAKDFIVTEFPYKGKMSVISGTVRVYPALNKYVKERGFDESGWVMEIYDVPGKKIIYRKEIIKN